MFRCSRKFSVGKTQKVVFHLLSNRISRKILVNGKQPLITSHTNLATLKLDIHSSVQTLIDYTPTLLIFRFVIASMKSLVFECSDNFLCFSLCSRTSHYENTRGPAHYENTQCYFSVGLPRTVCAFVSLTLDNILQ